MKNFSQIKHGFWDNLSPDEKDKVAALGYSIAIVIVAITLGLFIW